MNKLLDYARKAMFYVRVLSGYEERRIRSYRLQIEKQLQLAQARRDAVKRIPEQLILSEVRRMVEEMKNLNNSLNDIEADIKEYFKPIDKEVESLMSMQMEKEKVKGEMLGDMYKQAMLEMAEKEADKLKGLDDKAKVEMMTAMFKQSLLENAKAEAAAAAETQNRTKASSSSMS